MNRARSAARCVAAGTAQIVEATRAVGDSDTVVDVADAATMLAAHLVALREHLEVCAGWLREQDRAGRLTVPGGGSGVEGVAVGLENAGRRLGATHRVLADVVLSDLLRTRPSCGP